LRTFEVESHVAVGCIRLRMRPGGR
jgi:hypothetical protein